MKPTVLYLCSYEEDDVNKLPENSIRPVARTALTWDQVMNETPHDQSSNSTRSYRKPCPICGFRLYPLKPCYFIFVFLFSCKISVGQVVMANYNPDEPDERGYWYDVKITKKVRNLKWRHNLLSNFSSKFVKLLQSFNLFFPPLMQRYKKFINGVCNGYVEISPFKSTSPAGFVIFMQYFVSSSKDTKS